MVVVSATLGGEWMASRFVRGSWPTVQSDCFCHATGLGICQRGTPNVRTYWKGQQRAGSLRVRENGLRTSTLNCLFASSGERLAAQDRWGRRQDGDSCRIRQSVRPGGNAAD